MDSLRELPSGATYRARSGRASVEVGKGRQEGTIVVYAECDSLQRLVEEYARRLEASASDSTGTEASSETTQTRKPHKGWWAYLATLLVGAAAGGGLAWRGGK